MLVFLFLYKITVFSLKGKFINSATSDLSKKVSAFLSQVIISYPNRKIKHIIFNFYQGDKP